MSKKTRREECVIKKTGSALKAQRWTQMGYQNSLDRVHPVLCLIKDNTCAASEDFVSDLHLLKAEFLINHLSSACVQIME